MSATGERDLAGRRAVVMGLGLFGGGLGAARWLVARGARVTVTDLRDARTLAASLDALAGAPVELVLGEHREADFARADLVVANPAVPPASRFLALARAAGARVTSDVELFLERTPARVVAITGTQGKSSTCHLTAELLARSGVPARLAGNVGRSPLELDGALEPRDVVVLELSSYQLEHLPPAPLAPGLARAAAVAVTNVLADHLERHGTLEAYAAAKRRIVELCAPGGVALLPSERAFDAWQPAAGRVVRFAAPADADERARLRIAAGAFRLGDEELARVDDLALPGAFQQPTALVALGLAHALGAPAARLAEALRAIRGLPHRLEDLGEHAGRRVLDNAVSTTPDSTIAALRSLAGPCTLLCGGQAKRLPLDELAAELARRGDAVVTFGAAAGELERAFAAAGARAVAGGALADAVALALERTPAGGTLLFSPACASFDAFANFRARAEAFRAALALHARAHAAAAEPSR